MQLSTRDVVAIAIGAVQLLASIAIGVWTVRRTTQRAGNNSGAKRRYTKWSFLWAWLKSSWVFMLFFALACHEVWSLATEQELSKTFVLKVVLYSVYAALNIVAAVGFFIIGLQMELTIRLASIVEKMNVAQGQALKIQQESLAVTGELLAAHNQKEGACRGEP